MQALQDQIHPIMLIQQDMEDIIYSLHRWNHKQVLHWLGVTEEELAGKLEPLKTDREWADVLLMEVLYNAMVENLDNFPTQ